MKHETYLHHMMRMDQPIALITQKLSNAVGVMVLRNNACVLRASYNNMHDLKNIHDYFNLNFTSFIKIA